MPITLTKGLLTAISKATHDVTGEARVPAGGKGGGEWTTGSAPQSMPDKYAKPPKGIVSYPLSRLVVDAARMQFRQDVNPDTGTDDRLAGVEKFDQTLAGVMLVWKDPKSGKVLIADGHHRYALAKRLKVREVNVEFINAPDANRAMIRAAIVNVAAGHSTPMDAAKLFRADGMGEKALSKAGISLEGTVGAKGLALSKLAPELWTKYVQGTLPEGRAIAIGRNFQTHAEQIALAGLLNAPKYKNSSDAVVAEIAKQVPSAGQQTKTVQTLFGEESITRNLAVEKAQVVVAIRAKLMADKKLFGFVAKQGRDEALKRGGNVINAAQSGKIADESTRLVAVFDAISGYAGSLSSLLSEGAKQVAEGVKLNVVTDHLYGQVRESIAREYSGGNGSGLHGSGAADAGSAGLHDSALSESHEPQSDGGLFLGVRSLRMTNAAQAEMFKAAGSRSIGGGLSALPVGGKEVHGKWGEHNGKNAFIATNGDVYQRPGGKSTPFTLCHGPSFNGAKAQASGVQGHTWSEELQAENPGSHWSTQGGKRVLIKKDGKPVPQAAVTAAKRDAPVKPSVTKPAPRKPVATKPAPKAAPSKVAAKPAAPVIRVPAKEEGLDAAREYARAKYDEAKAKAAETKSPIWKAKFEKEAHAYAAAYKYSRTPPDAVPPLSAEELLPQNLNLKRLEELRKNRDRQADRFRAMGGHDYGFHNSFHPNPIVQHFDESFSQASKNYDRYEEALEDKTFADIGYEKGEAIHVAEGKESGRSGTLDSLRFTEGENAHPIFYVTLNPRVKMEGDSDDDDANNQNFLSQMFNTDLSRLHTQLPLSSLRHGSIIDPNSLPRKIKRLTPKAKAVLDSAERESVHLHYERGVCVTPDGRTLVDRKGSKDTITLSPDDIAAMTDVDAVMTHNHPGWQQFPEGDPLRGWLSFSLADVDTAIGCSLAEIRAVTGKYVYSLKPGRDRWGTARAIAVRPAIDRAVADVKAKWMPKIASKQLSCDHANMEGQHELWKQLSDQFGWNYTRTEHTMAKQPQARRTTAPKPAARQMKKGIEGEGVELDAEFRDPMFTPEKVEAWVREHPGMNKSATLKIAMLFKCAGSPCKGKKDAKPANNLSQLVRDAHHANKHAVSDACDHESADKVLIAGKDGKKYPATHCHRCGRIALDDKKHHKLASDKVPMPVLVKAVADGLYKGVGESLRPRVVRQKDGSHHVAGLHEVTLYHADTQGGAVHPEHGAMNDIPGHYSTPQHSYAKLYTQEYASKPGGAITTHRLAPDARVGSESEIEDNDEGWNAHMDAHNVGAHNYHAEIANYARSKGFHALYRNRGDFKDADTNRWKKPQEVITLDRSKLVPHHEPLQKAVASNCYADPKSCDLRWVTVHPNGAEPGTPLLVHDNGEEYTVVGGAGGSMNQQVFQKPKGDASGNERKAQMREKRVAKQKAAREALGADAQDMEDKKAALHAEAKRQTEDLTNKVLAALGDQFQGNALDKVQSEAKKRALKEHAGATEGEQKEFADKAAKEAVSEAHEAARKVVQAALNSAAMRALGDDDGSASTEFAAKISGQQLVKKFTPDELDSFVQASANIAALKGKAKAIARALATGDQDAVQGIQADCAPLSPEEARQQNLTRYLAEDSVNANTALVKGSEAASTITQRRNQANGASDGLNSFVAAQTGSAILRPDAVKTLGVENAARVAAAYLTHSGKDAAGTAEGLRDRIAQSSYASVKAALDKVDEMDSLVANAKEAAATGDGSVTTAQASITAANMANLRYKSLNVTRGQLRAAGALAHHLEHPSKRSLSLPAGSTAIAAHAFAKGLGLKEGDYAVDKSERGEGGGYKVTVKAEDLHKLAQKHSADESDRNVAMDELRQDVEQNPGQWHPEGFSPDARLMPHQELAARAIVQNKRMVLNYGAGSGKTPTAYAAAAQLLSSGKCKQGLITMPAKPRAQQGGADGEAAKFLTPELAGKVAVVKDGADLKRCFKQIASGEKSILVMSPHLMREKVAELKAAGFGGDKSFYFADEAHEFAIGNTEGAGSGMAKAAHEMAGSEYAAAMSGTLIENNASELHSLYDMMHPGALGSQKQFTEEWKRLAQGGNDFFSSESMRGMRDRLSGGMVSYHKPVTDKNTGEALTLDKKTVTVQASPEQKAAIAKLNVQYQKDRKSEDPGIAKAAALRREAAVKRVLTLGVKQNDGTYANPKYEAVRSIMQAEKARDPKNRVGIYAFERKPLAAAGKAAGGKMVQVTGDDDDKATAASVAAINDRTNNTDGIMLSNAGNYGLNLQGMDHLIKMHAIDTPSKEDQLDHRHFRTGQTRNVRATTILTDHPSEQLAQFRTTRVKLPEVALLATLADDSKAASLLAPRMKEIQSAAGN